MARIYLDMDGSIANLYGVENWLQAIINEETTPYEVAERLVDERALEALAQKGYTFGVISWTAKNGSKEYNKRVRTAKVQWLAKNFPNIKFEEIHIVKFGTPKYRVANIKNQILVDDEEPNRKAWKGLAIRPEELMSI